MLLPKPPFLGTIAKLKPSSLQYLWRLPDFLVMESSTMLNQDWSLSPQYVTAESRAPPSAGVLVVDDLISEAAKKCLESFNSFLLSPGRDSDAEVWHHILDQRGRFKLWASTAGAFARYRASLDYRLRDSRNTKDLIMGHLNMISRRIKLR